MPKEDGTNRYANMEGKVSHVMPTLDEEFQATKRNNHGAKILQSIFPPTWLSNMLDTY